jgi:hypothetical protein
MNMLKTGFPLSHGFLIGSALYPTLFSRIWCHSRPGAAFRRTMGVTPGAFQAAVQR